MPLRRRHHARILAGLAIAIDGRVDLGLIDAVLPAQRLQGWCKCRHVGLIDLIGWAVIHEHADAAHLPDLLGTRGEWPRNDSCAEQRSKLSPSHECSHPVPRAINGLHTTQVSSGTPRRSS